MSPGRPIIHGRYSKHLPKRLAESYQEALADATLISLSEDLAVLDAMISETLSELSADSSATWWKSANDSYVDLKAMLRSGDPAKVMQAMGELGSILQNGLGLQSREQKLLTLVEQRRKLVDTESKRIRDMQENITKREGVALLAAIVSIVEANVSDRQIRSRIATDIAKLAYIGVSQPVERFQN